MKILDRLFNENNLPLDLELKRGFVNFMLADNSLINQAKNPRDLLEHISNVAYEVRRIYDAGERHRGKSYLQILKEYQKSLEESPEIYKEEGYD